MVPEDDGRRPSTSRGQDDLPVVDLWFSGIRELEKRMRQWISADGIFVATPEPQPPSSVARVRLILADGFVLTEGTAVVVWARSESEDSGCEPGMGMRWMVLPEPSRQVIEQLVAEHQADGGHAFDPDRLPEGDLAPGDVEGFAALHDQPTVVRFLPDTEDDGRVVISDPGAAPSTEMSHDAPELMPAIQVASADTMGHAASRGHDPEVDRAGTPPEDGAMLDSGLADALSDGIPPDASEGTLTATDGAKPAGDGSTVDRPVPYLEEPGFGSISDLDEEAGSVPSEPMIVMPDEDDLQSAVVPVRRTAGPVILSAIAVLVVAVAAAVLLSQRTPNGTPPVVSAVPTVPPAQVSAPVPDPTPAQPLADAVLREPTMLPATPPDEPVAATSVVLPQTTSGASEADAPSRSDREAPAGPPSGASRAVAGISWSRRGSATVVEIQLESGVAASSAIVSTMSDPPRVLVRFPRVAEPFSQLLIPVASPELAQIRSWLHSELRPPELHIVLDLAGDRVSLLEVRREEHTIVLVLGSPAGP
jgi:hypothetical protein